MIVRCTDHQCIYCADDSYYGLCKLLSNQDTSCGGIARGGIGRMCIETCENKTKEGDNNGKV